MSQMDKKYAKYFTDFDNKFVARLSQVFSIGRVDVQSEISGISAKYNCRVKVQYQRDLMRLLEEGMLLAVRNFKTTVEAERFTLLEISKINPEHFGLRGLSDHSYYPMQFEIIEQSVSDWGSDDKSTMMIRIDTIPLNYDLILKSDGQPEYAKGFSYPIIAERAYVLNKDMIDRMYNKKVLERMGWQGRKTPSGSSARETPRVGTIKMFESDAERIPIYVDFERLVRYHFGVFSFTGGGKSNLLSSIIRRLIYHARGTKIVILDISMEYPFLLQDVFADPEVSSKIVLEMPVKSGAQLYRSIVKPKDFERDDQSIKVLEQIFDQGKVGVYTKPTMTIPTFKHVLDEISSQKAESGSRQPTYRQALDAIQHFLFDYLRTHKRGLGQPIDEEFVGELDEQAQNAVEKFKVSDRSNVYAWATTRSSLLETIQKAKEEETPGGLTVDSLVDLVEGPSRLTCLSIADTYTIKELAIHLTQEFLNRRKREFKVEPYILFVFDEAQEFIPSYERAHGIEKQLTDEIETLLRQGRKYGLGGCIATQRLAHLNTNALQQLHTYFIGTLPRPYDRSVVSSTFTIDQGILEKTLEFAPGEWLLSSYLATGMENVPIFIKADNTEEEIRHFLIGNAS